MALFRVEDVGLGQRDQFVRITGHRIVDNDYVAYTIELSVDGYTWTCERRYSEFCTFDRQRFANLKQSILPPKTLFGGKDEEFIRKRSEELQRYLRTVFELEVWLQKNRRRVSCIPLQLSRFLDFNKYEIHAIVDELSYKCYKNGEKLLSEDQYFSFTPLELHAITERLKLAEPTCEAGDPKLDFGHLIDFIHRLKHLKVAGTAAKTYGTSSINPRKLAFTFHSLKSLVSLWIVACDPDMFSKTCHCRQTVVSLTVHYSLKSPKEILTETDEDVAACSLEIPQEDCSTTSNQTDRTYPTPSSQWTKLRTVDFSFNQIRELDESMINMPNVSTLNLSCNWLTDIAHLHHLSNLTELNLSNNRIEKISDWHKKLGNVKRLVLNGNKIRYLQGLAKLYSLQHLDLRDNNIVQATDVRPIGVLPCLETLFLSGNPLETRVEYRTRVLEAFADRLSELRLDGELANSREVDTVGVRVAIRKAKEERERMLQRASEQIFRALNPDDTYLSSDSRVLQSETPVTGEKYQQRIESSSPDEAQQQC